MQQHPHPHHPVFRLTQVVKSRPGTEHYRLVIEQLTIQPRQTLAIVGDSGCGKSTALDLLACALRPDAPTGQDQVFAFSPDGERVLDVYDAWEAGGSNALASDRMQYLGYILQTGGLLPFLTAADNITLACKVLNIVPERIAAIRRMTDELNITPLLGKYPAQISVGERQRVAIARALAHGPAVILADEPTAALDPAHSRGVMELFLRLARNEGATVIMVSHDQALARDVGFTLVPMHIHRNQTGRDEVVATLAYEGEEVPLPADEGPRKEPEENPVEDLAAGQPEAAEAPDAQNAQDARDAGKGGQA